MELILHSGLGDGFIQMFTQHGGLAAYKYLHQDEEIIVRVISNNADLVELYKYNPLVTKIISESQTDYLRSGIPIPSNPPELYANARPFFHLNDEEKSLVDFITGTDYVFLHLYSSTPRKKIEDNLDFVKLVDFIIDNLKHHVVFFGKSHEFDEHSQVRGYPSCVEVLNHQRPGLFNFTREFLEFNNPRVGAILSTYAKYCILAESAYLQVATYADKKIMVLLGKGMEDSYKADIDNYYYRGFRKPGNSFMDVTKFNEIILKEFDAGS